MQTYEKLKKLKKNLSKLELEQTKLYKTVKDDLTNLGIDV